MPETACRRHWMVSLPAARPCAGSNEHIESCSTKPLFARPMRPPAHRQPPRLWPPTPTRRGCAVAVQAEARDTLLAQCHAMLSLEDAGGWLRWLGTGCCPPGRGQAAPAVSSSRGFGAGTPRKPLASHGLPESAPPPPPCLAGDLPQDPLFDMLPLPVQAAARWRQACEPQALAAALASAALEAAALAAASRGARIAPDLSLAATSMGLAPRTCCRKRLADASAPATQPFRPGQRLQQQQQLCAASPAVACRAAAGAAATPVTLMATAKRQRLLRTAGRAGATPGSGVGSNARVAPGERAARQVARDLSFTPAPPPRQASCTGEALPRAQHSSACRQPTPSRLPTRGTPYLGMACVVQRGSRIPWCCAKALHCRHRPCCRPRCARRHTIHCRLRLPADCQQAAAPWPRRQRRTAHGCATVQPFEGGWWRGDAWLPGGAVAAQASLLGCHSNCRGAGSCRWGCQSLHSAGQQQQLRFDRPRQLFERLERTLCCARCPKTRLLGWSSWPGSPCRMHAARHGSSWPVAPLSLAEPRHTRRHRLPERPHQGLGGVTRCV